jgi:AraC-like DNA-binding protein
VPGGGDGNAVPHVAGAHLLEYVIKLHRLTLNWRWRGRQAFAACANLRGMVRSDSTGYRDRIVIQHWAEGLVARIGGLEPDTVAANFIDRILRGAENMGASRPRLLTATHMTNASLRNPVGRASRAALVNLLAAIEREFGDPAMGVKLASAARPGCFSDLGFVAMFAPTVGDMIASTVDIQGLRQNVWRTEFDRTTNPARLRWHLPDNAAGLLDASIEFSLASYVHLFRHSLDGRLSPVAAQFAHQPRFGHDLYEKLLGCRVVFGVTHNCIEFDNSQLQLPSPHVNPALQQEILACYHQAVDWLANGRKFAAFSYIYLASELNKSPLKLERVAASFGLTERTLRRKLVEDGYPFRELLEKVRRDFCNLYVIENRRSMGEIAELLGYSELSAFTRAHSRWYGKPPSMRGAA